MNRSEADWELLGRIRNDAFAFQSLFEKHKDYVYRLARGFLNDASLADDAVQETFTRVYRADAPTHVTARFRTWLYRVTLNTCRDMRRKRFRQTRLETRVPETLKPASTDIADAAGTWMDIEKLLASLPNRQREVLLLRYFEGLSTQETAEIIGCSEGTVKVHLHRAVKSIRKALS